MSRALGTFPKEFLAAVQEPPFRISTATSVEFIMFAIACKQCAAVSERRAGPLVREAVPARCFASSSRSQAQKRKKALPNPNAMSLTEAAHLLKSLEVSRPFSAYELEVVTKFDKTAPPLRGSISLPRDARKDEETVLVFAVGELAEQAKAAGAKYVGGEDLIPLVLSGEVSPTKVLATPDQVPVIAPKLARFLGQKGMMPTAKRGTVRTDIAEAVKEAKGLLDWKGDKQGHVRAAVARITFPIEDVESNVRHFIKMVKEGTNITSVSDTAPKKKGSSVLRVNLGSTHGPSIELNDVA